MSAWAQLRKLGLQRRQLLNDLGYDSVTESQAAWLRDCLHRNRNTAYGREYQFTGIGNPDEFQEKVPLAKYESLEAHIARIVDGETDVLFSGAPVLFERTSGSSSRSKIIPYSEHSLIDFQSALLPWLADTIEHYGLVDGKAYWAISPVSRAQEYTDCGIPIGISDAQYLGQEAISAFSELSAVPIWVGCLESVDVWKLVTSYYLLREFELELVSIWSPTFLQVLIDSLLENFSALETLLEYGGTVADHKLAGDSAALARLRDYAAAGEKRDCSSLWPNLKLVSCWGDASSRPYFRKLASQFPHSPFQRKGLLSTEGVITTPEKQGDASLCLYSGFYEFMDVNGKVVLSGALEADTAYQVVITTSGGLYRYCTGDEVVCTRKAGERQAPALRFTGRSGVSSDLVGEKLTEVFVSECLADICGFAVLVPAPEKKPIPTYVLLLEAKKHLHLDKMIERVDQRLKENPHYAYARRIGQLGSIEIQSLQNPLDTYTGWMSKRKIRLGDIKLSSLHTEPDFATYMGVCP